MMAMVRPQQPTMAMIPRPLMLAMVYSSLSGLISGYQMGIAGGALNSLQSSSLDITSSQAGHITSIYLIGLMVAGPFGGYATDKFGRRTCILYMDGLLFVGSLLLAVAPNYKTLLAGRFIVGCATAVSLVAAVSYLTELASVNHNHAQHHRGALVLSVQASIALGFLASYLASYALSTTAKDDNEEGVGQWRLLFGVGTGLLAGVQWMGMRRMPESPQWLTMKGYYVRAHVAVSRFTNITNPTPHDGSSIIALDEDAISSSMTDAAIEAHVLGRLDQTMAYGEAMRTNAAAIPTFSQYWRQAVIIAVLAIVEQFGGHINVINFAPVIFAEVFYNEEEKVASEDGDEFVLVVLGVLKLLITLFVLFSVDQFGRLFFLKAGATIVTVSLLFVAISLSVNWEGTVVSHSGDIEYVHSKIQDVLVLIGCTGVVTGFALSYGPVWLIASELSPSSIRGRMLGFFTVLTHGCAAFVTYTFISDQEKYGNARPFWIYFVCSLAGLAFFFVAVPETEGVDGCECEDVESLLDETPFWSWSKNSLISRCFGQCRDGFKIKPPTQEVTRIDFGFDDVVDTNRPRSRRPSFT